MISGSRCFSQFLYEVLDVLPTWKQPPRPNAASRVFVRYAKGNDSLNRQPERWVGRVQLRCLNTNSYGPSGNKVVWGLASLKHLFEAPKQESPTDFFLKSDSFPKGEASRCLPQDSSRTKEIRLVICWKNIGYRVSTIVEIKGHSLWPGHHVEYIWRLIWDWWG